MTPSARSSDLLPFAAPLRAVDEVWVEHGRGITVHARKTVVATDPYLAGHFPAVTVYPGVFIVETVRQAVISGLGGALELRAVRSARFVSALVPGDMLHVRATVETEPSMLVRATCLRGKEKVATVVAEFGPGGTHA